MSRTEQAKALFEPLGPTYDRYAALLSYGQDPRWRRFLVSRLDVGPGDRVLDVATGTGAVAAELVRQKGCRVVGVDQSAGMLAEARRRLLGDGAGAGVELVEASADALPFVDSAFDGLTFTYLLRYVEDPAAVLGELVRVVRPGATVAALEFGLPDGVYRAVWELHVRALLPAAGRAFGSGWGEVGSFLGGSIRDWYARWPLERQLEAWREAGVSHLRTRALSFGAGRVTWGLKA